MTLNAWPSPAWIARFVARAITLRPDTSLALACEVAHEFFHEGWRENPNAAAETWHHLAPATHRMLPSESTSTKVSLGVDILVETEQSVSAAAEAPHA